MKLALAGLVLGLMAAHPAIAAPVALLQPAERLDAEALEAAPGPVLCGRCHLPD